MTSKTNEEAVCELLDHQQAEVESYVIRADLFLSALSRAASAGDSSRLAATRNMVRAFIASRRFFEQKWLGQRLGVDLDVKALAKIAAMDEQISFSLQALTASLDSK